MSFVETRLLDCVSYGTEGGPTWSTRRIGLKSGIVRRNPTRSRPLYRFSVLYNNLKEADHAAVIDAFNACYGGVHSFRLKDWADFTATNETLSVLWTGGAQSLQLTKAYTFGTVSVSRSIRKPVVGTVTMTHNGSPLTASINYTTGVATFTTTAGHIIRWSGQFDVPVMFEDDALLFSAVNRNLEGLVLTSDVALVEDLSA